MKTLPELFDADQAGQDETLLWIMLVGQSPEVVPHTVALAERVKVQRYKTSGEELQQFIDDSPGCARSRTCFLLYLISLTRRYETPDQTRANVNLAKSALIQPLADF